MENGLNHVIDVDQLFREHHVSLTRYLTRHCGDADVAADVVQETYLRLIARPPAHDTHMRAWLFTVATNVIREAARTSRRRHRLLHLGAARTPMADPARAPDGDVEAGELRQAMDRLLADLPDRDRTMLLMREEGFSHQEIADAVQVKPGSVGTLLVRALEKIAPAVERMSKEWL
jgi:RNA polymerase sigma-70 factor (ECF subfamily)